MAQHHVKYIVDNLGYAATHKLTEEGLDEAAILAVDDCWHFDPEDEYDPVTFGTGDGPDDVPGDISGRGCGVHLSSVNGKLYIVGDNGMCAFYYRLSKQA